MTFATLWNSFVNDYWIGTKAFFKIWQISFSTRQLDPFCSNSLIISSVGDIRFILEITPWRTSATTTFVFVPSEICWVALIIKFLGAQVDVSPERVRVLSCCLESAALLQHSVSCAGVDRLDKLRISWSPIDTKNSHNYRLWNLISQNHPGILEGNYRFHWAMYVWLIPVSPSWTLGRN